MKKITLLVASLLTLSYSVQAAVELNEKCVVNILNRTIQVSKDGGWALPNVPVNMGRIRARATCLLDDGSTISGQSDYFTLANNQITDVGAINFIEPEKIPTEINFAGNLLLEFSSIGKTQQLQVQASYKDGQTKDVSTASAGMNYATTNPQVVTVSPDGLLTSRGNGVAFINARKDGVLASLRVQVKTAGDKDGDGLPDEWELANGLNPADPVDAFEDKDKDGLSNLAEFNAGTNPATADTDFDGISDFKELNEYQTNPVLADTDGDGLNDQVEILTQTDPNNAGSVDYRKAVRSLRVTPPTVLLTFSGVDTEVSTQLKVTATLLDGSQLDVTSSSRGTRYSSSDLSVISFGTEDGKIFGGQSGNAVVTIRNGDISVALAVVVESFAPSALAAINIPGYANNVDVAGDYAYVAAGQAGLQIIDVSNRRAPQIVGQLDTDGVAIDVKVRGNLAYVADGDKGLKVINVATPAAPVLLSALDTDGVTQDLQLAGHYAYLANGSAGIDIVDVTNPSEPVVASNLTGLGTVYGLDGDSNLLVVVAGSALISVDVSDKLAPARLGSVNLGQVKDVAFDGSYAYVAAYSNGYRVVDLTNPAQPRVTGGDAAIVPRDVALTNGLAFFAEQLFPNVTAYVNIEDPEQPVFQGTIDLSRFGDYAGTGIALDGSYAYITEESFVVGQDYGISGNTKLFIAQYRMLNDTAGVSPEVELKSPVQGDVVVERQNVLLSATANDDVAVRQVDFLIDGVLLGSDTSAPYVYPWQVPGDKRFVNVQLRAWDLGGNSTLSTPVRLNVQPDKDADGLGNDDEADRHGTDPNNPDTDADGLLDGREVAIGTNPLKKDTDDDGIADAIELAQGTNPLDPDVTAPVVESTDPANDSVNIPENQGIAILFDEPLQRKSVVDGVVTLKQQGTLAIVGSVRLQKAGRELYFTPASLLQDFTQYQVTVAGVRDNAGNLLAQPYQFSYTTGNYEDTVRPTVSAMTPQSGATDVPLNALLTLLMSEPINPDSVDASRIYLTDNTTGQRIDGTLSVSEDNLSVHFVPSSAFVAGRQHQLYVSGIRDLFQNEMYGNYYSFTTSFAADGRGPQLIAQSIPAGATELALNSRFQALFDEPLNVLSMRQLRLLQAGVEVPANRSISNNNRLLTLTPLAPLQADTDYVLHIGAVTDLTGNVLPQEKHIQFRTGQQQDTTAASVSSVTPASGATQVGLQAKIQLVFSEAIDVASVFGSAIRLYNENEGRDVAFQLQFSADGKVATITPLQQLKANQRYAVYSSYYQTFYDVAGNAVRYHSMSFTTAGVPDQTAPQIRAQSFTDGAAAIPVNGRLLIQFDEPLHPLCLNSNTITLSSHGEAQQINFSLSTDRRQLTLTVPSMAASRQYQLTLDGLCDNSGNAMNRQQWQFQTSDQVSPDNIKPALVSMSPAHQSMNVDPDSAIVLQFSELIDPVLLTNLQVTASGVSGQMAGTWQVEGNQLTFTPLQGYPSEAQITVYLYGLTDIAGNQMNNITRNFRVSSRQDNTAPSLVLATPGNGQMDIGPHTPIVLTFSESMRENTINNNNLMLFIDGNRVNPSIYRSSDNRILTLESTLPSAKSVSVVLTDNLMDLAGNRLANTVFTFQTAVINNDTQRPSIARQSPLNGAGNVLPPEKIYLYANKELAGNITDGSLYVAANGIALRGSTTLDAENQALVFEPQSPLPANALIEVFIPEQLRDRNDNLLYSYRGSFTTGSTQASVPGRAPVLQNYFPAWGSVLQISNPQLDLVFDQPLDGRTVNANTVQLRPDYSGAVVPADITLSADGRRVSIKPTQPLSVSRNYYLRVLTGLKDVDGDAISSESYSYFTTAAQLVVDDQQPMLQASSPMDGQQQVPRNVEVHARFDEPVNPLWTDVAAADEIQFLVGNRELRWRKAGLQQADTVITESFSSIRDAAGQPLRSAALSYRTRSGLDVTAPQLLSINPPSGSQQVPVNTALRFVFSEVVNPLSLAGDGLQVLDAQTGIRIAGTVVLGSSGREAVFTPAESWAVNRTVQLYLNYFRDLAGNSSSWWSGNFTAAAQPDNTAPQVELMSVREGEQNVPQNARLRVKFDEAMNPQTGLGARLLLQDQEVAVRQEWSADRRLLTLTPLALLEAHSSYQLSLADVQDLAANTVVAQNRQFTTGNRVDLDIDTVTQISPANGSSNVAQNALIEVQFSAAIDDSTLDNRSLTLSNDTEGREVPFTYLVSPDRLKLTLKPVGQLVANQRYSLTLSYHQNFYDIAGNAVRYYTMSFTTGNRVDQSAPAVIRQSFADGAVNIPVNARLVLQFDEVLNPACLAGNSVQLLDVATGTTSAITAALSTDRRSLVVTPAVLVASGNYQLTFSGLCDASGNIIAAQQLAFTTSAVTQADLVRPVLQTMSPQHQSTNVDPDSAILLQLSEEIDPTQLSSLQVTAAGVSGQIAGEWQAQGSQLIFTPQQGYPSEAQITVYLYGLTDLAGNQMSNTTRNFRVGSRLDNTAPRLVSTTPVNGQMDIGPHTPIVLTFSESMRENTINNNNLMLFIDGNRVNPSIYRSSDNRVLTLESTLASSKSVSVVLTDNLMDLAGNRLANTVFTFQTAVINTDRQRPSIARQSPLNGASQVRPPERIYLYANKELAANLPAVAVEVSANGRLVKGRTELDADQQALVFIPETAIPNDATIDVWVPEQIRDRNDNLLYSYRGSFSTGSSQASVPGRAPVLQNYFPAWGSVLQISNPQLDLLFDQPLDGRTVNANTVQLRPDYSGAVVPADITLSADGRRVSVKPTQPLSVSRNYYLRVLTGLKDVDGDATSSESYSYFNTAAQLVVDDQQPMLQTSSPMDGQQQVPRNVEVHARFDEPVNPLWTDVAVADEIQFLVGNSELRWRKTGLQQADTVVTESFSSIRDAAGQPLRSAALCYRTRTGLDVTAPQLVSINPPSGSQQVPVNTALRFVFSEVVNPLSLAGDVLQVYDSQTGNRIAGTLALNSSGREAVFTPTNSWEVNRTVQLYLSYFRDLAGNQSQWWSSSFTAAAQADSTAPQVELMSVREGEQNVPQNARLRVKFDEAMNPQTAQGASVWLQGQTVAMRQEWSADRRLLTLIPLALFTANSSYSIQLQGMEDIAGNVLPDQQRNFVTGNSFDLQPDQVVSSVPGNGQTQIALNVSPEISFSAAIDTTTVNPSSVRWYDSVEGVDISWQPEFSVDGKVLKLLPAAALRPNRRYYLYLSYNQSLQDIAGNNVNYRILEFTTGN